MLPDHIIHKQQFWTTTNNMTVSWLLDILVYIQVLLYRTIRTMIKFDKVSLIRQGKQLLDQSDLMVYAGQRMGLTGVNGCGKSSVFSLLCGNLHADQGEVNVPTQLQVAHMAQEVEALDYSAIDYVLDGDDHFRRIQKAISTAEINEDNNRLALLYVDYEQCGGYTAVSRAEQLLHGLGFGQHQVNDPVKSFSGGWRMRLNLAKTLMCPSDLLLLDEPTNHLDLETIIWLEKWLQGYDGTLIVISHDRDFLDAVVTHIIHIEHKILNLYTGNYSDFEKMRAARLIQQQAQFNKQEKHRAHLENFVRRFRAKASKAKQAQSRLKALDKLTAAAPAYADSPFTFSFQVPERLSDPLLSLRKADLGYGDHKILRGVNLTLHPGQCIGLLGANGSGKSTLLKMLSGEHQMLQAGEVVTGEHTNIGYFSQHQLEYLDQQASPMLLMQRMAPNKREQVLRDFLGTFNFRGNKALQPVESFSGGEQARLALALIVWHKPNLLLLDEPTNHLDLDVRHAITVSLQGFVGCIVLISHDRHFIRHVTSEFMLIHNQKLSVFDGDLEQYSAWLNTVGEPLPKKEREKHSNSETALRLNNSSTAMDKKDQKKREAEKRKHLQPLKKRISQLEKQLEKSQSKLDAFEHQLQDVSLYQNENKATLKEVLARQSEEKQQHQNLEDQWFSACDDVEQAEIE